jgi:anti-sigma regulatory factor (Ser/Thr protein kinase)
MPTAILRSLHVTPDAASISAVRDFVRECCADWGVLESSDTAVLLASELATNAVRYAATPVTVWLGHRLDRIVLSVEDASHASTTVRDPNIMDEGGRGLLLVDALADRWGERELATGKLVWAEIATRPPSGSAPTEA